MLTFYNWRIKRSGAALRIIGDAVIGAHKGSQLSDFVRSHKISNIGAIVIDDNGEIVAHDRDGKHVAFLAKRRITSADLV